MGRGAATALRKSQKTMRGKREEGKEKMAKRKM